MDSMESQSCEQQERANPIHLAPLPPSPFSSHTSSLSPLPPPPSSPSAPSLPPCSPSAFRLPPPSPLPPARCSPSTVPSPPSLLLPPPPSPRPPLRHPSLRRPRPCSAASFSDPADEEVYHITSSAHHRWQAEEVEGEASGGKAGRSHSLSPYATPHSLDSYSTSSSPLPPLPPSSSRSALSLLGAGLRDRDLKKGLCAEHQGFLAKPTSLSACYPEDQRRHSIEVCLPPDVLASDDQGFTRVAHQSEKGAQAFPVRVQSVGGGHRKKKMSPPCISIHPPSEREHPQMASPPKLADCSMMLRRRTPSYDLALHTQPSMQDVSAESQTCSQTHSPIHNTLTPIHVPLQAHPPTHTLTLSQASTPTHTPTHAQLHPSTPTHSHIPISPNIFVQPHAPLFPNTAPFSQAHSLYPAARHAPHAGDFVPLPQFTYDQPQSRYMSGLPPGLSDADSPSCSSTIDSRLGSSGGYSATNRRTAQ